MCLIIVSHKSKYLIIVVLGIIMLQFTRSEPCHSIMGLWQEALCRSTEAAHVWRKGMKIRLFWDFSCGYAWISFIYLVLVLPLHTPLPCSPCLSTWCCIAAVPDAELSASEVLHHNNQISNKASDPRSGNHLDTINLCFWFVIITALKVLLSFPFLPAFLSSPSVLENPTASC